MRLEPLSWVVVGSVQVYAANTNNAFLLSETVVIAQALLEGFDAVEIKSQISVGLLHQRSQSSRVTVARAILNRLNGVEPEVLGFLLGNTELSRVTNLYTFLRSHRLLREFFVEVLQDKRRRYDHVLRPTDVGAFFTRKLDQVEVIAGWSDSTLRKAQSNLLLILTEARVLESIAGSAHLSIVPVVLPFLLRSFLERQDRAEELSWFA